MLLQFPFHGMVMGSLLAAASASYLPARAASNPLRRWDSNACTAQLSGVPMPDDTNFNFPLESYRQSQCWDLCIGDQISCATKSQICYDFVGYTLVFYYKPAPGYTYSEVNIWLGLSAPTGSPSPQYSSENGACAIAADGSTAQCTIAYSQITTNSDVLAGMCPYGDQQALSLFLYTDATLSGSSGPVQAEGGLTCQDYPTCSSIYPFTYWVLGYRCTKCPTVAPPPPVTEYCSFGTAFGYSLSAPASSPLNLVTPLPNTCKRWGWYETPTVAQLTAGMGGPLYVGAGQNIIAKAISVGTWSATLSNGKVFVTYSLSGSYSFAQVHVDIGCMPFPTCSPGQYTYVNEALATSTAVTSFTTPGLPLPVCSGSLFLIVHASINTSTTIPASATSTFTCAAPVVT